MVELGPAFSADWLPITILSTIGLLTILYAVQCLYSFLALHLLTSKYPLKNYKREDSEPTYALITGASAGIGLGIAKALVKQGFGVILLGHLADELSEAKISLQKLTTNAAVRIIVMDARTATPSEMASAVHSISDLQVSILVNNVGGMPIALPPFRTFATYSCEDIDAVINQNSRFMARLTTLMIPLLTKKKGRVRSLVLNLSSAAYLGMPYLVMYGATKGFINSFSAGLARELCSPTTPETNHIDVLAIIPGEVHSQGNAHGVSASEPTCDVFAECIVKKAENAIKRKKRELRPWMMHEVKDWVLSLLPEETRTVEVGKALEHKKEVFNRAWERGVKDR